MRAVYSGTENEDTEDTDDSVLGVCMQADPFAPPVPLAGYEAKVFVTKHDYYSRQFDAENLFGDYVKESVTDAAGIPWGGYAVSGSAVRKDIKNKVSTDNLVISDEGSEEGTVDAYLKSIYVQSVKDDIEETEVNDIVPNERNKFLNGRKVQSDIRFSNPTGSDVWNLDYFRGTLEYFTSDTTINKENHLEARIANRPFALMPYFIFGKHESAKVADIELLKSLGAQDSVEYPHGIVNKGYNGTLNASQLQGAHLGYGEYIFSQNADDPFNNEDSGRELGKTTITIPYIQKFGTPANYIMRIGNVLKHYHSTNLLDTEELSLDESKGILTKKHTFPNANTYKETFGDLTLKVDNEKGEFDFLVGSSDSEFAAVKALSFTPSSIRYKYLLHSYQNENADKTYLNDYPEKDKREDFQEPMNEALQAIYELPLATFQYNRNFNADYNKDSYFKRFFGIIVEQTANTSQKFKTEETIKNATSVDNVEYTYTADEKESIYEYLKLLTDDKEVSLNTNNAIGILLKAAKETQERLLNLEVSTYGKDSPTLPGADEENENFKKDEQKSTIAGLNRLVRALCREVFQDADPINTDDKGAWSEDSENYSRLDMLDKEVNGLKAQDDDGQSTRIQLADVTTYPDDASESQTVTISREAVKDDANDDDFDTAQKYIKEVNYSEVNGSSDAFDGLNDAVNRIVAKLNTLTADVKGSDNIKNRPLKLDYIRQTLETILREIYDDEEAKSDALENDAYKKTKVSRIDRLVQSLFNFDLDTVTKEGTFKNFNGKNLKYKVTSETEVAALSPESIEELNETASIIDVIIQLLTGDEKALVRTDYKKWKDRDLTTDGYKVTVTGENGEGVSYNPTSEGFFDNNKLTLNNESIVSRLDTIEKVLQLLSLKVQNKLDFRTITQRNDASPYPNVTSIDDFFNYVEKVFGITFEKNGFYATERKQGIKAESIKNIIGKEGKKTTSFDLYNIIYDAVKRIKNNEWALKYNEVVLGSDYDDYKDKNFTKDTYEPLDETEPTHTKKYTVTSDMKAILKLLYGKDNENTIDDVNNHTSYEHFEVANEKADDFTHSSITGGVSVLDELYTKLYTVPRVVNLSNGEANTDAYENMTGYSLLHYDPQYPRETVPSKATNPSLLGMGRRSKFIAQAGKDAPLSRIDILENTVKAIYNYIGFGSNTNTHYYSGEFTFKDEVDAVASELWGSLSTTDGTNQNIGAKVSINGNTAYGVHNRYHEIDLKTSEENEFHLSAIALQAYFNTVDIASLLFEVENGQRDPSPYSKDKKDAIVADTPYGNIESNKTAIPVESSYAGPFSSYSVATSIKKLLTYAAAIDKDLMEFKAKVFENIDASIENDKQIWAVLGDNYSFNDEGTELEDKTKTVSSRLTSIENTIVPVVKENKDNIAKLREELGESGDASGSNTVYGRVKALEDAEQAITKSLNNTDTAAGVTFVDKTDADGVYKNLKGSSVQDDPNDKDKVVLATKASVETLVQAAVTELQKEMTTAIQNNRKLAAMMAYMKCDDIKANANAVEFVRSGGHWSGYDMQEKELAFNVGSGTTGRIAAFERKKYCGEDMIEIELEDYVDHLKFKAYVPYKEDITATGMYENQTFKYGSNNNATSLDDDSYIVRIY